MEEEEKQEELTDIEIAELANKEIKRRDAEIAKLKKDLAKAKLLSVSDEEQEEEVRSEEELWKTFLDIKSSNYDILKAAVELDDLSKENGEQRVLGDKADEINSFLKDCFEECGDDPKRFTAIYQARLGEDPKEIALAGKNKR